MSLLIYPNHVPCMLTIAHLHTNITMRTPKITISHALYTYSPWCIPLRYFSLFTTHASDSTILSTHSTYHSWHAPSCTKYNQGTRTNSTMAHAHGIYYHWYTPFIHLSPPNSKILCSHSTYHLWYTPFIHLNTILACTPKKHNLMCTYHPWYSPFMYLNTNRTCTP